MARNVEPDNSGEIPSWVMTFSDVITLLMTFFILLLTFATNEPESFEQMQVSLFGGGGATGIAGPRHGPLEKDALLMRVRPDSGRLTTRGSEMPPLHSDPKYEALSKGIAGLEDAESRHADFSNAIDVPIALLFQSDKSLSAFGRQHLRMLANKLRTKPYNVTLQVTTHDDLGSGIELAKRLFEEHHIAPGRIGVSISATGKTLDRKIRTIVTRQMDKT